MIGQPETEASLTLPPASELVSGVLDVIYFITSHTTFMYRIHFYILVSSLCVFSDVEHQMPADEQSAPSAQGKRTESTTSQLK